MLADQFPDLHWQPRRRRRRPRARSRTLKPEARSASRTQALKQNITTLHNRVNELGVAEPVIQQQGADRIVVQLPGVQDTAQGQGHHRPHRDAGDAHGRRERRGRAAERRQRARCRSATSASSTASGQPVIVKQQVVLTGDHLTDAQPGFDNQTPGAGGAPDARRARARASSTTSRARTSASAWPSCCSRRARARWSPRR